MVRPRFAFTAWLVLLMTAGLASGGLAMARGADAPAAHKRHILVLNSYHQGYHWTDNLVRAIEDAFADSREVILHIEYMDTKKDNSARHFSLLRELLANKYRDTRFDVVIASDDDALDFLRQYRAELFTTSPVVFCGIANYVPAKSAGLDQVTGVNEAADFRPTLNLISRWQPQAETLYVISDSLTAGQMIRQEFAATASDHADRFQFVYLTDDGMDQLLERLRGLDERSAVFYLSFFRDGRGQNFDPREAIPLITEAAPVPVYGQVDYMVGMGILGGMVKSSYYQGKVAADLAKRILAGEPASSIPVVMDSPNAFMFDYLQLERFGIPLRGLPEGSLIVNEPETFYYHYKALIWSVLAAFAGLMLFIVILLFNIRKRKRAQRGLQDILEAMGTFFEQGSLDRVKTEIVRAIRRVIFMNRAIDRSLVFSYPERPGPFDPGALVPLCSTGEALDAHADGLIQRAIAQSSCIVSGRECVVLLKSHAIPGNVLYLRGDRQFDDMDRDLLEILANNVSMAFEALEKTKLQETLETARVIQQSMLPRDFGVARQRGHVELFARLIAAKEVGGDLYDFFPIDDHRFCVVIGDVSGKGVPAALFMAMAKTLIRSAAEHDARPDRILDKANNELARDNDQAMFVTLFLAILDHRDGILRYANAGHNPPYLVGRDGVVKRLPMTIRTALGALEDVEYQCDSIALAPGDGLLLYTDGINEAMSPENEEFGDARLEAVLRAHAGDSAETLVAAMLEAVQAFAAGAPQSDDITLLFLRTLVATAERPAG